MKHRIITAAAVASLLVLSPVSPVIAQSAAVGQVCSTPLEQKDVTTGKGKRKKTVRLVCWHRQDAPESWSWVAHNAAVHTPYTLPATPGWKRIATPPMGGDPRQLARSQAEFANLSRELDHYWIEVPTDGGRMITAGVWAPKGAANLPVVVFFHGTAGLIWPEHEFAASLARSGFVVVVPAWFLRGDFQQGFFPTEQVPGLIENVNAPAYTGANLEVARSLLPLLAAATQQPGVNPAKLALSGNSRGGTIAMLLAATTPAVKSVVPIVPPFLPPQLNSPMFRGRVWEVLPKQVIPSMTQPVLLISASNDERVPPASTQDFLAAVKASGVSTIESLILNGSHQIVFSSMSPGTAPQARQATIDHFNRTL